MADIFTDLRLDSIENVRAFVRSNYAFFAAMDEFGISTTYLAKLLKERGIEIQAGTLRKYITECARDPNLTVDATEKKHHLQSLQSLLLHGAPPRLRPAPAMSTALSVATAPSGADPQTNPPQTETTNRQRTHVAAPKEKLTPEELAEKYNRP